MTSIKTLWERAIKELKSFYEKNNNSMAFDNYIKTLKPEGEEDGVLLFTATGETARDMAAQRFSQRIAEVCADTALKISGVPVKYSVKILTPQEMDELLIDKRKNPSGRPLNSITLNSSYTFDSFVVGNSNRLAYTCAQTVSASPGETYNPLFLYGGVGLGKTHLLHAIGNEIIKEDPYATVIYITSETYLNEYVIAMANKKDPEEVKNKYRSADVLLIDDIQFISKSEATQEELYHTFNTLYERQKQIVFSSDKPPTELNKIEERLLSRFSWGTVIDIGMPDFETKIAIILSKIPYIREKMGCDISIDDDVIRYIVSNEKANVRDIEGAVRRVMLQANMNSMDAVHMNLAEDALTYSFMNNAVKEITPRMIIKNVCDYFDVTEEDILSVKKNREIAIPRQIAMYLMRSMLNLAYPKIGDLLGGKHYSTVMFACNKITDLLKTDKDLKNSVDNIMHRIKE